MVGRGRRALGQTCALALLALALACTTPRAAPTPAASTSTSSYVRTQPAASASPAGPASVSASASAPASASASIEQAPADALVALAVPGFGDAVVALPALASSPRGVVVALHGNFDRPEWQCEVWQRITQRDVFVLCPRGIPRRDVPKSLDRWEWGSVAKTKAELLAALAALRARYPERARPGPFVFAGFSLGAILGARLLQDPTIEAAAAVLIEGGYEGWTPAKARTLRPRLRRLVFACGQTECRNAYRYRLGALFEAAGVASSLVSDVQAGHTYDDPLAALLQSEWPALAAVWEMQ